MRRTILLSLLLAALWTLSASAKPNIIYIMVDDMGYSDVGAFGVEFFLKLVQGAKLAPAVASGGVAKVPGRHPPQVIAGRNGLVKGR